MINVPPRSLKTQIVSIAYPAWAMWQDSSKQFMGISYASWLAEDNSRDCRNMYVSETYRKCFPRAAAIQKDQDTKKYRRTEDEWHYYASWSTGTITWKGCDVLLIDDPLKPDEADSDTVRTAVNNNYYDTLKSRLNDKTTGAIIIIMQRLHDWDLCGDLLEKESNWTWEKWEKLIIPSIAEVDDEYRKMWESFFEKRFPIRILRQLKQEKAITFSCQYQQNPVNKETQEFHEERFRYHGQWTGVETPLRLRVFTTCDPAFKKGQHNDNSCIMTAWFVNDKMYILEYTLGKWSADVLLDKLVYHIKKRSPEKCGIEAFQAQTMISTFLRKKLQEMWISCTIEEITQRWDKLSKIRRLVPLYRNWLIYHKLWMEELEWELKRFPRGKHDDAIDAEQMLYDLYTIQPNSITTKIDIKMEWDEYWRPLEPVFYWDDWLANA
jgi:predicted phage terminase large subunit-like protein